MAYIETKNHEETLVKDYACCVDDRKASDTCFINASIKRACGQEVRSALENNRSHSLIVKASFVLLMLIGLATQPTFASGTRIVPKPNITTHPFYSPSTAKLPSWVSLRHWDTSHRAAGDQSVFRQTTLLTPTVPGASSFTPATSSNEHPFWTSDEKFIYFDSNRVDATTTGSTPDTTGIYNIYRMFPDGSGLVQVNPQPSQNQLEPAVSSDGSRVAYVAGGSFVSGAGTATPVTSGFNLFVLPVNSTTGAVQLTNVTSQFSFTNVMHPSWSPGGNAIVFAGQLQGQTNYHLFVYTLSTGNINQLTSGPSNDNDPAWSPSGDVIAFSTNSSGFPNGTGPAIASGTVPNYDIYLVSTNPASLYFSRATDFAAGGQQSSNFTPSWSSLSVDPLGVIPTVNGALNTTQSIEMLAFATTRADSNNDGIANSISSNNSTDIYWLDTQVQQPQPGEYIDSTPETTGNTAHKLQTSAMNADGMSTTEPDYNFDLSHLTNESFPTWPQYQASYRIAFQSDRGGDLNIWASSVIDINAPTLLKYDAQNNIIVGVSLNSDPNTQVREVQAGQTVRFRVSAVEYQTGIESVFLQIKCPESAEESPDSQEHRVYVQQNGTLGTTGTLLFPEELDSQAVDAQVADTVGPNAFPRFKANGVNGVGSTNLPGGNLYEPGDDSQAFSGLANPPDVANWVSPLTPGAAPVQPADAQGGSWLQLYDDGPAPGGHEPAGETANDGIYTGVWTTPAAFPSDWIIDVILRNRAVNPFDPTQAVDWKIYDNVWGFTTKPFQQTSDCLYVDDYDSGQKFLNGRFGGSTFGNVGFLPTESYMTEESPALFPTTYVTTGGAQGTLLGGMTTLGVNSYTDGLDNDGSGFPPTQRYDIWRIQCRGPLPVNILDEYAPYTLSNPPAAVAAGAPATVLVAEKCVIWHSPYTGDLFVGPGTLLDQSTQQELTNFVAQGGRLMVMGQDVAWGLTLGGGFPSNPFLNNVLMSTYTGDNVNPADLNNKVDPLGTRGVNPITAETWNPPIFHNYPGAAPGAYPPDLPPGDSTGNAIYYNFPITGTPAITRMYSCPNQDAPDTITFAGAVGSSGVDGTYDANGSPAIVWNTNPTTGSRIVYSPFGWEGIMPGFFAPPGTTNVQEFENWRMELVHNALDYLRTGRLVGTVRVINSSSGTTSELAGVLVTATNNAGVPISAAVTQNNGTYTIYGLPATGLYALNASKAGFVTQHATSNGFHGAYQSTTDFYMTQSQPGTITGHVLTASANAPVGGAIVVATDQVSGATFQGVSVPLDGSYTISNVPSGGTYTLAVTNATQLGYSGTVEGTYTNVQVAPNSTVSGKDFHLKALPGTLSGTVFVADANGNPTTTPIPGATVTATSSSSVSTGTPPVFTTTTATNGTYTISNIDVGTYSVVATASGFSASNPVSANVLSQQTTANVNFALKPVQPGSITGLIETSTGIPVSGATVTVVNAAGATIATATTSTVQTGTDPTSGSTITYNYTVPNVPAGAAVTVSTTKSGYTPQAPLSVSVQITPGTASNGVNLILNPLAAFTNGLSMVSAPYLYTVGNVPNGSLIDVATLLSVPQSDVSSKAFQFIYWDNLTQTYVYHPNSPADTFHIGNGYFLQDTNTATGLDLTQVGVPAPQDANGNYLPYNITLKPGWNMIGDPFTSSVDFTKLQVQLANGSLEDIATAQTGPNAVIGAALWTFQQGAYGVVYTIDPYRGYWLEAFQPCSLVILPSAEISRAAKLGTAGRALEYTSGTGGNWKLSLQATVGNASLSRATLGQFYGATNGYDQFKMMSPPTPTQQGVVIAFDHSDWGTRSGAYSVDVRSQQSSTWNFTVQSNIPNQPVTITWPDLATVGHRTLILTDTDTNVSMDMGSRAGFVIPASSSAITAHFQLSVQTQSINSVDLLNVSTTLGSTRADGAATLATIRCTLTSAATLNVLISHNGEIVRNLAVGQTRAAGGTSFTWDLKNNQGVQVPAGVYQIEVTATNGNGHQVPRYVPLVLTR